MELPLLFIYNSNVQRRISVQMASEYRFFINISSQEYLQYYAGEATTIQVHTVDGVLIQFPASAVKPWVTHQGVNGCFVIKFDKNHKLIELKKIN